MVLDSVPAASSKLAYGHALDQLFAFSAGQPLSRSLLQRWRASMDTPGPSPINVRLSAARKLVEGAWRNGMLGAEAAGLTDVPNVRQQGTRLGNWLIREQARELLQVPDRSTLGGKRDYVILALLVGCALRRQELASLDVQTIQLREGRWVLADMGGKGRRVRTVAVPVWVKQGINAWMTAAAIEEGRLLRSIRKEASGLGIVSATGRSWTWCILRKNRVLNAPPIRGYMLSSGHWFTCRFTRSARAASSRFRKLRVVLSSARRSLVITKLSSFA